MRYNHGPSRYVLGPSCAHLLLPRAPGPWGPCCHNQASCPRPTPGRRAGPPCLTLIPNWPPLLPQASTANLGASWGKWGCNSLSQAGNQEGLTRVVRGRGRERTGCLSCLSRQKGSLHPAGGSGAGGRQPDSGWRTDVKEEGGQGSVNPGIRAEGGRGHSFTPGDNTTCRGPGDTASCPRNRVLFSLKDHSLGGSLRVGQVETLRRCPGEGAHLERLSSAHPAPSRASSLPASSRHPDPSGAQ